MKKYTQEEIDEIVNESVWEMIDVSWEVTE